MQCESNPGVRDTIFWTWVCCWPVDRKENKRLIQRSYCILYDFSSRLSLVRCHFDPIDSVWVCCKIFVQDFIRLHIRRQEHNLTMGGLIVADVWLFFVKVSPTTSTHSGMCIQRWTFCLVDLFSWVLLESTLLQDDRTQRRNVFPKWQTRYNSDGIREWYNTSQRTQCTVVLNIYHPSLCKCWRTVGESWIIQNRQRLCHFAERKPMYSNSTVVRSHQATVLPCRWSKH